MLLLHLKNRVSIFFTILFTTTMAFGGNVQEFKLNNGIKTIFEKIDTNPIVTFQIFMKTGITSETKNKAGLTAMMQTVLMKGTKTRSSKQLATDLENIGANMYPELNYDYSSISISVLNSNTDKALEILSDVILNPAFDDQEIKKEKRNMLANILSRQDSIHAATDEIFIDSFFAGTPYSWPDCGLKESVEKISKKDIIDCYKKTFTKDNMLFVVCGDIEQDTAREALNKYFSNISALPAETQPEIKVSVVKNKIKKNADKFQQAYLMIGFPAPEVSSQDYAVLKVINAALGSRMSGRLFTELREKLSLAYEVNSFYPSRKNTSRFVIYLGLKKENIELARNEINRILTDIKKTPLSQKELNETKNYISGIFLLDHQTTARKAWNLGWWEIMGKGFLYDTQYLKDLKAVTSDDIQKAANKYFTDNYVEVEIAPK